MRFILTIECDNAAFDEYPNEAVSAALVRLAQQVSDTDPGDRTEDHPFIIRDVNGARVGAAHYEEV